MIKNAEIYFKLTFFFNDKCASVVWLQQEPGDTATEILNTIKYVRPGNGYVPNFPMFAKVGVNGEDEHPLFTYLKVSQWHVKYKS